MKHLRLSPSPAMVVACIALTVALAGTSYAAIKLPKNSVGAKQLKRNAVTSPKVKNNAIAGVDVINAAQATGLRKADIGAVSTTVIFDPPNVPAGACSSETAAVTGAVNGDVVITHPVGAVWSNLMYAPWLAQTDVVSIRVCNPTSSAVDGPAVSFHVLLIR